MPTGLALNGIWMPAYWRARGKGGEPIAEWSLHDFRRSMSTTMHERLNIEPHIVEECLGHATFRSGVSAVYNRSRYREAKRRALELWANTHSGFDPARVSNSPLIAKCEKCNIDILWSFTNP